MTNTTTLIKRIYPFILGSIVLLLVVFLLSRILSGADGIEVVTFETSGGWGYQVEVNSKVYIYQPFIPGASDTKPFPSQSTARKTGRLVEEKLKAGLNPAISGEELKEILEQ